MPAGAPARQALQGPVAVDLGALAVDNLQSDVEAVGHGLDELGLGHPLAHAQMAGHEADDEKHAGHREKCQQAKHDDLAGPADDERGQGKRTTGKETGEQTRTAKPAASRNSPRCGGRQAGAYLHVCHGRQS